jgi:hypothetical protein
MRAAGNLAAPRGSKLRRMVRKRAPADLESGPDADPKSGPR